MTTSEQADLAGTIRSLLVRRGAQVRTALDTPHGYDERLWSSLCEIGVPALAVPERFGGVGAGIRELQIAAEELGRDLIPSPLLGSSVLATLALSASADDTACARLLPALADGSRTAALAWSGPDCPWSTTDLPIRCRGEILDGTARYLLGGAGADILLAAAKQGDELGLFEVDPKSPGVECIPTPTMDPTLRLAEVVFTGARAVRIGGDFRTALAGIHNAACAVLAAEQVGAAARALQLTVDYTKTRRQFGRPIGSFQALKHRMADLHVLVESARSICYAAAEALDARADDVERVCRSAKIYCAQAFSAVAAEMIQLHGGIAITWEHDAQLYFKHAHATAQLFGQPHIHLARSIPVNRQETRIARRPPSAYAS